MLAEDGFLHVGGRLSQAAIPLEQRHPVILSAEDVLTKSLFRLRAYHLQLKHGGPTQLLCHAGYLYHVIGGRKLSRNTCKQCIVCRKAAATVDNQIMGQLPVDRITPSPPFTNTGLDFAGPFILKKGHTRHPVLVKAYLLLLVCFSTKDVHIEVVSDLTSEAFLAALKRFISRRGAPQNIHSDNGSNFIGAKKDLEELYGKMSSKEMHNAVHSYLLTYHVQWHTIPERAPHFGGLWEAAVKSTKHHLKRVVGKQKLTYEEMATVSCQVEVCLNSRPLGLLTSHSPDGMVPLTPGHFLIGRPLQYYPETVIHADPSLLQRWELCQALTQQFWRRWSQEYLQQLQRSSKWHKQSPNLKEGDLVMMTDGKVFQAQWTMGKIVATYPGKDGVVRAVDVMTKTIIYPQPSSSTKPPDVSTLPVRTAIYRRPIAKLALLLPVDYYETRVETRPEGDQTVGAT